MAGLLGPINCSGDPRAALADNGARSGTDCHPSRFPPTARKQETTEAAGTLTFSLDSRCSAAGDDVQRRQPGRPRPANALSLVRILGSAISAGCTAGLVCGIVLANSVPSLQALLSAEQVVAWLAFLIICVQVGAAVALAIAMLPEHDQ